MKCLNCKTIGKHFHRKICPTCTAAGVTRDDIEAIKKEIVFVGSDASAEAAKTIESLRRRKNISHVRYTFKEHDYDRQLDKLIVTWVQYEPKREGSHDKRKTDKSK